MAGDQHRGAPLIQVAEQAEQLPGQFGVQVAGGLVGQQQRRHAHDGAGDAHALLLARRQRFRTLLLLVQETHLVERGLCQLKIEVHDQGVGIASEDIDRIFDEFAQAKEDTSRHFGGTGLGLSISRKLAKEMGGDISASSIPGLGSVFTITVGLAIARAPKTSSGENVADLKQEIPPGLRVLVADDNPTNRLLIKKYLADCDLDLEFAFDGRQAVDLARSNPPDVIFMDMNMPEMNGIEATKMLRADGNSTTCIIALTANTTPEDQAASLAAGMNSFLSKPIRKAALLATLVEIGQSATHDISALKQAKS